MTNHDQVLRKAFGMYYRVEPMGEPHLAYSSVHTLRSPFVKSHEGRTYVCLADSMRILAVYRLRNCGRLAKLVRGPSVLPMRADPVFLRNQRDSIFQLRLLCARLELKRANVTVAQEVENKDAAELRALVAAHAAKRAAKAAAATVAPANDSNLVMDDLEMVLDEVNNLYSSLD